MSIFCIGQPKFHQYFCARRSASREAYVVICSSVCLLRFCTQYNKAWNPFLSVARIRSELLKCQNHTIIGMCLIGPVHFKLNFKAIGMFQQFAYLMCAPLTRADDATKGRIYQVFALVRHLFLKPVLQICTCDLRRVARPT